jgi:hypothetical protein
MKIKIIVKEQSKKNRKKEKTAFVKTDFFKKWSAKLSEYVESLEQENGNTENRVE